MSNVLNVVKSRNAKSDFKILVVLAFCFVALSFFAIGFMYAHAPEIGILVKLLAIMGTVNIAMVFYVIKKYNAISNT
ncbi:hypothetical protein VT06_14160 [Arsukibacterium sp. MJ3]|nr:hypothetical protein VT06_14160 [Arsukibacterium sp. MJ3]